MRRITKSMLIMMSVGVLGACSNGGKSAATEDLGLTDIQFPLDKKVTLKVMTHSSPLAPEDPNDKLIFQRLEEDTGVHIDWTNYQSDFAEKRNLDISSGDLPDLIFSSSASDYDLLTWAKNGVIVPLNDVIDEYMPNLKKIFEENPEYKQLSTAPDGNIYSFPWIEELGAGRESIHTVSATPWINVEWLNKLGLDMPQTMDQLTTVLEAFKNGDPNGNGEADEIPMSFISGPGADDIKVLFSTFGIGDNDDHIVVSDDGILDFTADNEEYKEAIKYFTKLQEKQLLDKESFEQDWNTYIAKGKDEKYGVYFHWDKLNVTGESENYDILPALENSDGEIYVTRTNGLGFDRGRGAVFTSANKNLELSAKWIDEMYDPVQSVQNNLGTYGDTELQNIFEFDEDNQMLKHLPLEGTPPGELRQKTEAAGPLAVLSSYYDTVTTMPDDAKWRLDIMNENYTPYATSENIFPRVFLSVEDTDRISKIDADMQDYIYRKRAEWINGADIDKEWDEYLSELERFGLSEWLEIKQNAYDNFSQK